MSRLLPVNLQQIGFTCGIDDLLIQLKSEEARSALLEEGKTKGLLAAQKVAGKDFDGAALRRELEQVLRTPGGSKDMDQQMKSVLNPMTSKIIGSCIPGRQIKPFPANNMSMMVLSGAK